MPSLRWFVPTARASRTERPNPLLRPGLGPSPFRPNLNETSPARSAAAAAKIKEKEGTATSIIPEISAARNQNAQEFGSRSERFVLTGN